MDLVFLDQHLNTDQILNCCSIALACNNFAKDAAIIPFPKEEVTPPVTKYISFDSFCCCLCCSCVKTWQKYDYKFRIC
jgi:hypothetical protein